MVVGALENYGVTVKDGADVLGKFDVGQGGTVTVSGLEADKNVSVEYAKSNVASISVSENLGSAAVAVNDSSIADGEVKNLIPDEPVTITATPHGENYIDSLKVLKNGSAVAEEMTFNGTAASVTFVPEENGEYTISVVSKEAKIVLSDNKIGYNDKMTTQQIWNAVYNLIDTENSVDGISADNVTIQYEANSLFGISSWQDLNYKPGFGHAFGSQATEMIKITYKADERYPSVTIQATISLEENRKNTVINLKENQSIEYNEEITEEVIYNLVFESLETEDGTSIDAVFGQNMTIDVDIENLAPAPELNTATVKFEGDDKHLPCEAVTNFTVTYAVDPAVVTVTENEGNAVVKIGEYIYDGSPIFAEPAESLTVEAEPANGYYIEDLEVLNKGEKASSEISFNGTKAYVTFEPKAGEEYEIKVQSRVPKITLKPGDLSINYNKFTNKAEVKASIFDLIDTENSVEGMTSDNVTVQYYASNLDLFGEAGWQELNYEPLTAISHAFGENSTEKIRVIFDLPNDKYPEVKTEFTVNLVDLRQEVVINLIEGQSIVYSPNLTEEDIYNLVFDSVEPSEIEPVFGKNMSVEINDLYAGNKVVVVNYAGDETHADASAQVAFTIEKADASVFVNSQVLSYADKDNIGSLVSADPEELSYISFVVGLDITNGSGKIHINIPELIDPEVIEAISNETIRDIIKNAYASVVEGIEGDVSVSDLKNLLQTVLDTLKNLQNQYDIPVNLNTEAIESLVSVLGSLEQLEGLSNLTATITVDKEIIPENSGAYLIGAVASDPNYVTDVAIGYLVITPDAKKVDLAFNISDENGFITRGSILSGAYDLGSHVVQGDLTDQQLAQATEKLTNVYLCLNKDGVYASNEPSAEVGAYVQISYIKDWGNDMYYAVPIIREYNVVVDTASVKFVDENGNVNNDRIFTYDGTPKAMTAVAKDRWGNVLDSSKITYTYLGMGRDLKTYKSSEAPSESGAYTVIAAYADYDGEELIQAGAGIGVMVINPADAEFAVLNEEFNYDGKEKFTDIINTNGLDYISVIADENNNVNIVLPESWGVNPENLNVAGGVERLIDIINSLPEGVVGSGVVTKLKELLNSITLNSISVNESLPTEAGQYNITAIAFGENYKTVVSSGVLTINELEKILIGDVDFDGKISIKDAALIQLHLAELIKLDEKQLFAADTDQSGIVNIIDVSLIQMYCANILDIDSHVGEYKEYIN